MHEFSNSFTRSVSYSAFVKNKHPSDGSDGLFAWRTRLVQWVYNISVHFKCPFGVFAHTVAVAGAHRLHVANSAGDLLL